MDIITRYLKDVLNINIKGSQELEDYTGSYGESPFIKKPNILKKDELNRIMWSRLAVRMNFAFLKQQMDVLNTLYMNNSMKQSAGEKAFCKNYTLSTIFKTLGTILDVLADEMNIVYDIKIPYSSITYGSLKGAILKNNRGANFPKILKQLLKNRKINKLSQFRHLATHRPMMKTASGQGGMEYLPQRPKKPYSGKWDIDDFMNIKTIDYIKDCYNVILGCTETVYSQTNSSFKTKYTFTQKIGGIK